MVQGNLVLVVVIMDGSDQAGWLLDSHKKSDVSGLTSLVDCMDD